MYSLRYIVRLISAYLSRFKGIILLGILIGAIIFIFFGLLGPLLFSTGRYKIGIIGRYRVENLPSSIVSMIGEGLTEIDGGGNVTPNLARSWETPDKGKTWIFNLKQDISWQDGEKLTSASINYQFSDVEVDKPDEHTIVFKLQEQFSVFPSIVSRPTFKKGLLGTGEWKVTNISLGQAEFVQKLILVNTKKDKQIYKFYPTEEQAKLAFKLGEVDQIQGIYNIKPFDNWSTVTISEEVNKNRVVVIFLNSQDKLLSDKSFRQALTYAIDKNSGGQRAISPISPNSWAYNPTVKTYDQDLVRAREFIDELPNELKENLSINLVTTPVLLSLAEKISKEWVSAGIKAHVQVSSSIPYEFQTFLAIFDIPTDPDQYAIWHSTQTSTNISKYQNPRIDKLLEDGRVELDLEERRKIYLDFQRFLIEDSPAIFLYHPVTFTVKRN